MTSMDPSSPNPVSPSTASSASSVPIPSAFKSQYKAMTDAKDRALKRGDREQAKVWDEKIQSLEEKITSLDPKAHSSIKTRNFFKAWKSVRWVANLIFHGVVHPSTMLYKANTVKEAEKLLSDKKTDKYAYHRINNYLDSIQFLRDFSDRTADNHDTFDSNVTLESISDKRQKDLADIEEALDEIKIKLNNNPKELEEKKELESDKHRLESDKEAILREVEQIEGFLSTINSDVQEIVQKLSARYPDPKTIPIDEIHKALKQKYKQSFPEEIISGYAAGQEDFKRELTLGRAKRLNFYTSNYDQIDGAVFYPKEKPEKGQPWQNRTLILVGGNGAFFEGHVLEARRIADKYGVNVVMYNGPGVGYSMGKEKDAGDAVDAFKGVFNQVNALVGGHPNNIAVIGHSLGGGITTVGLGELVKEKVLKDDKVGMLVNYHSFSSLSGVVGGFAGRLLAPISRVAIKILGIGNLNAAKTLKQHKVANKVVVVTAHGDSIMRRRGRLGKVLKILNKSKTPIEQGHDTIHYEKTGEEMDKEMPRRERKMAGMVAHNDLDPLFENSEIAGHKNIQKHIREWAEGGQKAAS